jgi:hypothetical protein
VEGIAIPLAALIISIATLIYGGISLGHKANGDHVDDLERERTTI